MRIFKTKTLAKFTRQNGISDDGLVDAVQRAARGLIDADLGGQLIKQRVARPGQGKRSGFVCLLVLGLIGLSSYSASLKMNARILKMPS